MLKKKITFLVVLLSWSLTSWSFIEPPAEPSLIYSQIIDIEPTIDGDIDSIYYTTQNKAEHFTTFEPIPGQSSDFKSEVYILFHAKGIYVAAQLDDPNPDKILRELSPRDQFSNSDYFGVSFDPYRSGLTGYTFFVTAAGVQIDQKEFPNNFNDNQWNEVWESHVKITETGWNVELFIPYFALRFPSDNISDWNMQICRSVRRTRELSYWNPVEPTGSGFLAQMGTIKNVQKIDAPLRLSITPYISGGVKSNLKMPNQQNTQINYSGGADLKYGINESFTLDATLIPDFSQVITDIQVLNLSPFEVQFDENRPFFTEGTELFNTADLFYSRRIGGNPYISQGELFSRGFQENFNVQSLTNTAPLINAIKFSGRSNNQTGIGIFNAIEGRTYADIVYLDGSQDKIETNPLTNYSVVVVDQGLKNNSNITFTNTQVMRAGKARDANVSALNWNLRNKSEKYAMSGKFAQSLIFQENGTTQGSNYEIAIEKIAGQWTYGISNSLLTDQFNPNDLGYLVRANQHVYSTFLAYNEYKPKNKNIVNYNIKGGIDYARLFRPNQFTDVSIYASSFVKWKTFFAAGLDFFIEPLGSDDYFEPRTVDFSRFLHRPAGGNVGGFISSDYRKTFALDLRSEFWSSWESDQQSLNFNIRPRIRVSDRWSIFPTIILEYTKEDMGYLHIPVEYSKLDPSDITIGFRDINLVTNSVKTQYIFSPTLAVNVRLNHYYSNVQYQSYQLLQYDGSTEILIYDGLDEKGMKRHDIIFNSFNADGNISWRFAPGSDLVLSYRSTSIRPGNSNAYLENLLLFDNILPNSEINVKLLYFLDVNQLRQSFIKN